MDYLKALPVEIWRQILFNIPSHWKYGGILSHIPLCLYSDLQSGYAQGRRDQRELVGLLLICRQLLPLVEEVLYTDVCLRTVHLCNGEFERLARVKFATASRRRGEWVKIIRADVTNVDQLAALYLSSRLPNICPNLQAYHQIDHRRIATQSNGLQGDIALGLLPGWLKTITSLPLSGHQLSCMTLSPILQLCSNLEILSLLALELVRHPIPESFPTLQRLKVLTMNSPCVSALSQVKWNLPMLQTLGVELSLARDTEQLASLIQVYGSKLVALHFIDGWNTSSPRVIPPRFLDYCPMIRQLEIAIDETPPVLTIGYDSHPLERLTILLRATSWSTTLSQLSPNFSQSMFPKLRKVFLVLLLGHSYPHAHPKGHVGVAIQEAASRIFPCRRPNITEFDRNMDSSTTSSSPTTPLSIQKRQTASSRSFVGTRLALFSVTAAFIAYITMMYMPNTLHEVHNPLVPSSNPNIADVAIDVSTLREGDYIGNFELRKKIKLNYTDVTITKWRSIESGLEVVHVDYQGPIINGYFAVATEIFDDSGRPHTLEHLVFHGSKHYPYSDALQRFTSRSFSATPNAWTAQDSTVYTQSTAGQSSFLRLLPVYVDHILRPRLTTDTFVTEVHHINGEGNDAGVVYSEMQGRQNTIGDLVDLAYRRKLYPEGNGYRSETGGLMEALRTLSLEDIKKYHSTYYVPHNLRLVITGHLSTHALITQVQNAIESQVTLPPTLNADTSQTSSKENGNPLQLLDKWKRPFVETDSARIPSITKNMELYVDFPAKEENFGEVTVITVGPKPSDHLTLMALSILSEYLAGNIVAPLNKELVDLSSPYCTSISLDSTTRATFTELHVTMSDVPLKYLDRMEHILRRVLKKVAKRGIGLSRIRDIIDRDELMWRHGLEELGGEAFSSGVLEDFLYGNRDGSDLETGLQVPEYYETLRSWTNEQWVEVMNSWMIKPNVLVVRGRPSSEMSDRLEREEKARLEAQVASLGDTGLAKKAKELEEAKEANEAPMPDDLVQEIPVPSVEDIDWIKVQSASTTMGTENVQEANEASLELKNHLDQDPCQVPYILHFDHVPSQFITVTIYMSLAEVPIELKRYVTILETLFFTSVITLDDGTQIEEEDLLPRLDRDLVSWSFGQCNEFPEMLCLEMTAETTRYSTVIEWMRLLLWSSKEKISKLKSRLAIMKQSIPEDLRSPHSALGEIQSELLFTDRMTGRHLFPRRMIQWLPEMEERLKRNPKEVMVELQRLREIILQPGGLTFSILGDVMKLHKPRSTWRQNFPHLKQVEVKPIPLLNETLSELGRSPRKKAVVASLATVESSFSYHVGNGISGFANADIPAIIVATNILHGAELYFWKRIRGAGLAYGVGLSTDVQSGHVSFSAYRSPNAVKAFEEAKAVVQGLVDRVIPLDPLKLEAAKNAHAYGVAELCSTRSSMADFAFVGRVFKGRSSSFIQERLASVRKITEEEVLTAMKTYILPLFHPETSVALIACGPNQAEEIVESLRGDGFDVELRRLDDRVPWATNEQDLSAKALKVLTDAMNAGAGVIKRTQEILRF
ncbi:hypothetical protein FRC17_009313 [Serendipita sp. 399]|nr:hypothetical protein FRC17_009313 [Serendipita sp. 399]